MQIDAPIRVQLTQDGDFAFHVRFEGTALAELLTDESAPLGHDRGPNPSRMLLAAIANCLSASLLFAMRKHHNALEGLQAEIVALPTRNDAGRWRLPRAAVELTLPGGAGAYAHLDRVLESFEEFCTVTQSVRQGIEVDVTVRDGDGRVLQGDKSFEAGA